MKTMLNASSLVEPAGGQNFRPLEDLLHGAPSVVPIESISTQASFGRLVDYFEDYPERALTEPGCRAFMYHLVRSHQPRVVLEIGTYFAGTTEVIARGLWANGTEALLLTIDPYGGDRVPPILDAWPAVLREKITYFPVTSMDFFIHLNRIKPAVDLAFVDGDHSYGFAAFDLAQAAKWVRPGGVIVMDDFDQPGVFWAVKHFLEHQPQWREISGLFEGTTHGGFAAMRPSVEGTRFLVLKSASNLELGATPHPFVATPLPEPALCGFDVDLARPSEAGTLHAKVFLRSFYNDGAQGEPEQIETIVEMLVQEGERRIQVRHPEKLVVSHPPNESFREVEIVLVWEPRHGSAPLVLAREPAPRMDGHHQTGIA